MGSAPTSTCLQSRCITCLPRPQKLIGTPPWCCPRLTEFWRLCSANWRSAYDTLVRLPGIAPGHAPWQRAILLLNHNREIKRAGSCVSLVAVRKDLPARAISIKNKHLLVIYSIPTRGFTAAVSVFRGTPPPRPLICKFVSHHLGALISDLWADPTGEEFCILCAIFDFCATDIIETSLCY